MNLSATPFITSVINACGTRALPAPPENDINRRVVNKSQLSPS
jgi:hypothetical protein